MEPTNKETEMIEIGTRVSLRIGGRIEYGTVERITPKREKADVRLDSSMNLQVGYWMALLTPLELTMVCEGLELTMVCEGCGREFINIFGRHPVCMECVNARARAAGSGRCSCGRRANPGAELRVGSRRWIPCRRCLGTIRQVA